MRPSKLKSSATALFVRLFFSFLLTAIVSTVLVFMLVRSFRPAGGFNSVIERNIDFYLTALHTRLSPDFTSDKISKLESDLGIFIQRADQPNPNLPEIKELGPEVEELSPRFTMGRHKGYFYVIHEKLSPRIAWMVKVHDLPKGFQIGFVGILGFLFAIFAMSFVSVHIFMKPIRVMLFGIEQIASGNIQYRLKNRYKHGFSGIITRFNSIADQLERFILSKDRLLRDVSHELRSPLTRMGVAINMLEDSKLKESLLKDSQIMNRLISDLLESFRVQKGKQNFENIDLSDFFISLEQYYHDQRIEFDLNQVEKVQWPFDRTLLEVIFKNLIENSIKYALSDSVKIKIECQIQNSNLVVNLIDNGPGINKDDLPHIFEPFYRSSKSRQQTRPDGFGLGLSIVKTYTELQNGQISVQNIEPNGANFKLEFTR